MSSTSCRFCRRDRCGIVELNKNAPKEVLDLFRDVKKDLKTAYKAFTFQQSQQKMHLQHKLRRNARMNEEYETLAEKNNSSREYLNQLKQADTEMDQRIASLERKIEHYKNILGSDNYGNNDISSGSIYSDPGVMNRGRRVEELFQKLGSPPQYPGGFAGSSFQLNDTRRSEGDLSFFGKEENLEMKTPVAWHKSRNNRRTRKRKTLSHEAKFLDIKTPAAWPKRQETSDWVKSVPTKFFSPY